MAGVMSGRVKTALLPAPDEPNYRGMRPIPPAEEGTWQPPGVAAVAQSLFVPPASATLLRDPRG